ncbi:MAG: nuclear transport factor 2 family protein [Litorimonas sp.]
MRALVLRLLRAYNAADPEPFDEVVSDDLPWKAKVLDEVRSGRSGQVDTLDVVVEGERAAEYWVERGMTGPDGATEPAIWGVNLYRIVAGRVIEFEQLEERRFPEGLA